MAEQITSLTEAVDLVAEYCRTHAACAISEAVETLKPKLSHMSSAVRWKLIVLGFKYAVKDALTQNGSTREHIPGGRGGGSTVIGTSILMRAYYEGFDGIRKPLIDFNVADLDWFRKARIREMVGLKKRVDAAEFAIKAIKKANVEKIGDLPAEDQKIICEIWEEVHVEKATAAA